MIAPNDSNLLYLRLLVTLFVKIINGFSLIVLNKLFLMFIYRLLSKTIL